MQAYLSLQDVQTSDIISTFCTHTYTHTNVPKVVKIDLRVTASLSMVWWLSMINKLPQWAHTPTVSPLTPRHIVPPNSLHMFTRLHTSTEVRTCVCTHTTGVHRMYAQRWWKQMVETNSLDKVHSWLPAYKRIHTVAYQRHTLTHACTHTVHSSYIQYICKPLMHGM